MHQIDLWGGGGVGGGGGGGVARMDLKAMIENLQWMITVFNLIMAHAQIKEHLTILRKSVISNSVAENMT